MNIFLTILQVLLAIHTAVGAVWKFSNPAQIIPSLSIIPENLWLALSILELLCCLGLILPIIIKRLNKLASAAALAITAEMLAFCGVHLYSGYPQHGQMIYWLVVAAISAFVAYGRSKN
ncbi:MAG: DoxX family protein [Myxococcota bacterium]